MPSTLPKKYVRKTAKPAAVEPAGAVLPAAERSHHGLAAVTIILLFLTVGCLAAATLISTKMKTVQIYAQTLAAQLGEAQQRNSDLTDQLTTIKTLQDLAKRVALPTSTPAPANVAWDTYASPNISLQYPDGYTVTKATSAFPALTIKSQQGRIEIFRMKDFPGGDRPFGFEDANVTQADLDNYIPKEFKTAPNPADPKVAPYNVWVYYGTGDTATKALLDQAAATIKVVK